MKNKEMIKILKKDINELKQKGFKDFKIIKGLSCLGFFEVDLMAYIPGGLSGFNKSYRTIKFKKEFSRDNFLKECGVLK